MKLNKTIDQRLSYEAPSAVCYGCFDAAVLCTSSNWSGSTSVEDYDGLDNPYEGGPLF